MGNSHSEVLDVEHFYRDDGSIEAEWPVLNGDRHGNMRIYYKSGNLRSIVPYVGGIKHGIEREYYDWIVHKLLMKCSYVNGVKHGIEYRYDVEGKLIEYRCYFHGDLQSLHVLRPDQASFGVMDRLEIRYHKIKCKIFK